MRPSTRRQLTFAAALLGGLFVLATAVLYVLYRTVPVVHEVVDALFPGHRGELVATVGIPLAEMRQRSSLPISAGFTDSSGVTSGVFTPSFDWQVLGTSLRFRGCRIGMYSTDKAGVIDSLQVSVSPRRLPWSAMVEELRATRGQLAAAGFLPDERHGARHDVLLEQWLDRKEPTSDLPSTQAFIWRRGDLEFVFYAEQQNAGQWVQRVGLGRATSAD